MILLTSWFSESRKGKRRPEIASARSAESPSESGELTERLRRLSYGSSSTTSALFQGLAGSTRLAAEKKSETSGWIADSWHISHSNFKGVTTFRECLRTIRVLLL
jgi:hypothetical protein